MKKVLIIGLILCFFSVSGCGGAYADAVTLNACISEEPLTIQLDNGEIGNVPIEFSYRGFSTEDSLEGISEKIAQNYNNTDIEILENGYMFVKRSNDGIHYDYFLIAYTRDIMEKKWYLIDNMQYQLYDDSYSENDENNKNNKNILFPKYIFATENMTAVLYKNREIDCICKIDAQEICDFYNKSGYYLANCKDDDIIIYDFIEENVPLQIAEKYRLDRPIILSIIRKTDKNYIKITER